MKFEIVFTIDIPATEISLVDKKDLGKWVSAQLNEESVILPNQFHWYSLNEFDVNISSIKKI